MSVNRSFLTTAFTAALTIGSLGAAAQPLQLPDPDVAASHDAVAAKYVTEWVYVTSDVDTDNDGKPDRIAVYIKRPAADNPLPVAMQYSPYFGGTVETPNHNVLFDYLPQDGSKGGTELDPYQPELRSAPLMAQSTRAQQSPASAFLAAGYATVYGYSIGNGYSDGCATVGDQAEAAGAKAVIDWLNGRTTAVNPNGDPVVASWATGDVGMFGGSYNGTIPNMVATTGVPGLKAIIPVAAISNWYDYFRANGLVVSPGGYLGEDADVLGKIVTTNAGCAYEIAAIAAAQDRVTGDYNDFWHARNYVPKAKHVNAAVFLMHGQQDWNVRQKHAIDWWHALAEANVPRKMWLHNGGHSYADRADRNSQMVDWFDRYVKGEAADVVPEPVVQVQAADGQWTDQGAWPHPETTPTVFRFSPSMRHEVGALSTGPGVSGSEVFKDHGNSRPLSELVSMPTKHRSDRIAYVTEPLTKDRLLSGTPVADLRVAVENRHAANLTVAVVDYDPAGNATVVTQGWADPQNHSSLRDSEQLVPGKGYQVRFPLEPKQHTFKAGHRIGVVILATDQAHTIRPQDGTVLRVATGSSSAVTLNLSK